MVLVGRIRFCCNRNRLFLERHLFLKWEWCNWVSGREDRRCIPLYGVMTGHTGVDMVRIMCYGVWVTWGGKMYTVVHRNQMNILYAEVRLTTFPFSLLNSVSKLGYLIRSD
jgi:hypothetical protein